jgi:hypothetical protein
VPASRRILAAVATLVVLTATDSTYGTTSLGPVATVKPSVSGTAAAGRRLTGLTGTWAGGGTIGYAFQWHRCDALGGHCTTIRGATAATYLLAARDVGKTLGLTVAATDATGTASAHASLIGPIAPATPLLVATAQPVISGTPIQGKTLQVTTGAWSPTPSTVTYSWLRCNRNGRLCDQISTATGNSYVVGAIDVGHALVAAVQASFGTTSQKALSIATGPAVGAEVVGPTPVAVPGVTGVAATGRQLTASAGTWSGLGPISYVYSWYRCDAAGMHCNRVRGATAATYTLRTRDAGRTIGLKVEATDSTGTAVAYGSLVGPIASSAVLISTAQPAIQGEAKPGRTLTVSSGGWSPSPASFSYAWQRCNSNGRVCSPIPGASASTYVATPADAGHTLAVVVTATFGSARQGTLSNALLIP